MTDYTKTTDFAAKDSLPSGDTGKIIRGTEFETEFDNISTSIATKANLASPTFTGTATIPTAAVTTFTLGGTTVTSTATELNLLDGVTATTAELNYLDVTTLGEVEASKAVTADSSGDVLFGDNKKALFGTGSDLKIYHDGSNSYIEDEGTGSLFIRSEADLRLQSFYGTEDFLKAQKNGAVTLYWANLTRLATSNAGVDVTGKLSATSLEINSVNVTSNGTELQLGGNLSLNSNDITGTGDINTTGDIDITGALTVDDGASISKVKSSALSPIITIRDNSDPNVEGTLFDFQRNNGSGGYTNTGRLGYKTLGSDPSTTFFVSGTSIGLGFYSYITTRQIIPTDQSGNVLDDLVDLGRSSARFDDIYATNSTIQTSDVNEKQDIDVLSDAEQRVAVAAKKLLKKFRWKSAVEEKGDDARIHFGIIAQDLQAAFQAEGLDAGRYGMFVSETWTDPETGEEKSRMGVRYSELLAFIISAI